MSRRDIINRARSGQAGPAERYACLGVIFIRMVALIGPLFLLGIALLD
jgi:hypothetical protein